MRNIWMKRSAGIAMLCGLVAASALVRIEARPRSSVAAQMAAGGVEVGPNPDPGQIWVASRK